MERDDRLFAVIGSCVTVGTTAIVWLAISGGGAAPVARVTSSVASVDDRVTASALHARPTQEPRAVHAVQRPDVIDDRDGLVRAATRRMTRHPEVLRWLMTDNVSHRIVETVDAVADGRVPRDPAAAVGTNLPFLVYERDGGFVVAAGTSKRFDPMIAGLTSIDPTDAVALLEEVVPELEASWSDRGGPGGFEDRLRSAVDHLLAVRIPTGPLEVERRGSYYEWADDDLQRASDVQKALLRTGRSNAVKIQSWLDGFRMAMNWTVPRAPQPVVMADGSSIEVDGRPVGETIDVNPGVEQIAAGSP